MLGAKNVANLVDDFRMIVSGDIINPEGFLQVSGAQRLGEANPKKNRQECFEQHWNPGERGLVLESTYCLYLNTTGFFCGPLWANPDG